MTNKEKTKSVPVYIVEWQDCTGCKDTFSYRNYEKACHEAMKEIQYTDEKENYYISSALVYEEQNPDKILYGTYKSDMASPVSEILEYKEIVPYIIHKIGDYSVVRHHDGFGLKNNEDVNCGNIEEYRFTEVSDMLDKIEIEVHDTVYRYLSEQAKEITSVDTSNYLALDWVSFMNENEEFKYAELNSYEICKVMAMAFDEPDSINSLIDLNEITDIPEYPQKITMDSPSYEITSFFEDNFRGIESSMTTYDWSKAEEFSHEHLCNGGNVEIYESQSGKTLRIKADEYIQDMYEHDFAEFPYKADYFESNTPEKKDKEIR